MYEFSSERWKICSKLSLTPDFNQFNSVDLIVRMHTLNEDVTTKCKHDASLDTCKEHHQIQSHCSASWTNVQERASISQFAESTSICKSNRQFAPNFDSRKIRCRFSYEKTFKIPIYIKLIFNVFCLLFRRSSNRTGFCWKIFTKLSSSKNSKHALVQFNENTKTRGVSLMELVSSNFK